MFGPPKEQTHAIRSYLHTHTLKIELIAMLRARLAGDYPLKSSIFTHSRLHSNRLYSNCGNHDNRDPNCAQS